jgi:catechol 2,3-dioxygenase-like lactoylglutathione lyase family enzyme
MINGIHAVIYTKDAEDVRAFFRDTLGLPFVDAGHGWLLFGLPPAELGIHPADKDNHQELWLMCDNIKETVEQLKNKGVRFNGLISDEGFGLVTAIKLPGGGEIGLFQPKHPTALHLRVPNLRVPKSAKKGVSLQR